MVGIDRDRAVCEYIYAHLGIETVYGIRTSIEKKLLCPKLRFVTLHYFRVRRTLKYAGSLIHPGNVQYSSCC